MRRFRSLPVFCRPLPVQGGRVRHPALFSNAFSSVPSAYRSIRSLETVTL